MQPHRMPWFSPLNRMIAVRCAANNQDRFAGAGSLRHGAPLKHKRCI
jgi:hypothetical protein